MVRDESTEGSWGWDAVGSAILMGSAQQRRALLLHQGPQLLLGAAGPTAPCFFWDEAHGFTHLLQTKKLSPKCRYQECAEL